MRLLPRHYALIAVILALGIVNIVRSHRRPGIAAPTVQLSSRPIPSSPAWTAFDKAAGLRDAPETQFTPALHDLQQAVDTATKPADIAGVKGCQTWLLFYRQSVVHPSRDTSWRQRSAQHLDTCVKTHQDEG